MTAKARASTVKGRKGYKNEKGLPACRPCALRMEKKGAEVRETT